METRRIEEYKAGYLHWLQQAMKRMENAATEEERAFIQKEIDERKAAFEEEKKKLDRENCICGNMSC